MLPPVVARTLRSLFSASLLMTMSAGCFLFPQPKPASPCATSNGGCDVNATCSVNALNAVTCACNGGYIGNGKSCTAEMNETGPCATNNGGCDSHATCSDNNGTAACMCNTGYTGDGTTCTPVSSDPCNPDPCDPNATCNTASDGGPSCTCNQGYTGDGFVCSPQSGDPCNPDPCDPNATCSAGNQGQAICVCDSGYTGNGITCMPTMNDAGPQDAGHQNHDAGPNGRDAGPEDAGCLDCFFDAGQTGPVASGGGTLATLASGLTAPGAMVISNQRAFWVAGGDPGGVYSTPIAGGSAVSTLNSTSVYPFGIAADATNIYWTSQGTYDSATGAFDEGDGTVYQASQSTGAVVTLASAQQDPQGITVKSGYVYWVTYSGGTVVKAPVGGASAATTLFSGRFYPTAIAVDATNVYWADQGESLTDSGYILKAALGSTTISTLASAQDNPSFLTIDTSNIYWANTGDFTTSWVAGTGSVAAVPISGTTVTTLAAAQDVPESIVASSSRGELYWVNSGDTGTFPSIGEIVEVETGLTGATPVTLVTGALTPDGIALPSSGTKVYFTDSGSGSVADGVVFSLTP